MKRALALSLALSLQAGMVFAHAALVNEIPASGATVTTPPALTLTFSEPVTLKFTGIKLKGADQQPVGTGDATLAADGVTLTVPAKATLTSGTYIVEWHALSDDGHKSQGSYKFTVK